MKIGAGQRAWGDTRSLVAQHPDLRQPGGSGRREPGTLHRGCGGNAGHFAQLAAVSRIIAPSDVAVIVCVDLYAEEVRRKTSRQPADQRPVPFRIAERAIDQADGIFAETKHGIRYPALKAYSSLSNCACVCMPVLA